MLLGIVCSASFLTWKWLENKGITFAPASADNRLSHALQAFQRGDLHTAVNLARQIHNQEPDNATALILLTRALIYRSYVDFNHALDREYALVATTSAYQNNPNNIDVIGAYAFALQANGRPGMAAEIAREALALDPNHTLAHTALALAYAVAGAYDTAVRESQFAVEQSNHETRLDALRALAISYSDTGQYQQAAQTVEQAIALNNNLIPLYFERALYALQVADYDAATVAYYQILVIDPNNVKARLRLCEVSSLLREWDAALRFCTEVTERAPGWADGWYQLGRENFLLGRFENAANYLGQCATLQIAQGIPIPQRRFECWYLQGQAAQIIGNCEILLNAYQQFMAMSQEYTIPQTWTYPPEGPPGCTR